MFLHEVLPDMLNNGARIGRADWLNPPSIKESYLRLEITPDGEKITYYISGKAVSSPHLTGGDLKADDWSVIT